MKFSDFVEKKLILEMAIKGDSLRGAIKLDSDDIQFLQQFRPELWIQAIQQRYSDDLYEALKARETVRKVRAKVIIEKLIPKLISGRFDKGDKQEFEYVFGPESLKSATEEIRAHYGKKWREAHKDNLEDAARNVAEDIAYYAVELEVPNVNEPSEDGYKDYKFGSKTTKAKPFINRLVHKLEKTRGKGHDPLIGLNSDEHPHGMYGFDLANPQPKNEKVPGSTDGMQFITHDMAVKAIKKLLGDNYYQYYGPMPNVGEEFEGKKIEGWKEIKLGRMGPKTFIDNRFYNEKKGSIIERLGLPKSENYKDMIEMEYDKTIEGIRIFKNKDETKIKHQGTDGIVHEDEISTRKEYNKFTKKLIKALITKFHADEKGPPIPGHKNHPEGIPIGKNQIVHLPYFKTKIWENGEHVEVEMPHVLPAKYYRKAREDDPDNKKHGHNKDIVHLGHDEYVKSRVGHLSGGSFHPGQNRRSEQPLAYGVKGSLETLNSIFGSMLKDDQGNYIDIIKGINSAIDSGDKRGMSDGKKKILKDILIKKELHDEIVERMKSDIRNKNLQTAEGRMNFAKNNTTSMSQQDIHGLGTRKLPTGKSMDSFSELPKTLLTQDQKEKRRQLAAGELKIVGKIGRRAFSGQNLDIFGRKNIKILVADIRKEIDEMDKLDPVKSAEHGEIDKTIDDLYRNQSTRKNEFFQKIRKLLHLIVGDKEQIYDPAKREPKVEEIIDRIKKKKTIKAMFDEIKNLTAFQHYLKADGHSRPPTIPSGDILQRKTQSNMPLKSSADKKTSAKSDGEAAQEDWKSLRDQEKYLALAFNSTFRNNAKMETLQGLKVWIDKNRVGMGINPDEYEEAMDNLDYAIAKKIAERAKNKT
jgi:hypothetical protein